VIPRQFDAGKLITPTAVPRQIAMVVIKEEELAPVGSGSGVAGGIAGGTLGGVLGGIIGSVPQLPPPPPPPKKVEAPPPAAPQRIKVGGNVQAAMVLRQVTPVYPALARQARVSGVVHLKAVISKQGFIQELELDRDRGGGHPLLVQAAIEAVKQWVYKPTLLNGEPVEVDTQIDVNFTLAQ